MGVRAGESQPLGRHFDSATHPARCTGCHGVSAAPKPSAEIIASREKSHATSRRQCRSDAGTSPACSRARRSRRAGRLCRPLDPRAARDARQRCALICRTACSRKKASKSSVPSPAPHRHIDFLWHRQAVSVNIRAGRFLHVSDQRRAGFVAGGSDEPGGRHGGQVSQNELSGAGRRSVMRT